MRLPQVPVLVGGQALVEPPRPVQQVAADQGAVHGQHAGIGQHRKRVGQVGHLRLQRHAAVGMDQGEVAIDHAAVRVAVGQLEQGLQETRIEPVVGSRKPIQSPRGVEAAVARRRGRPGCPGGTTMRGSCAAIACTWAKVSSLEPSSTTIASQSVKVWAFMAVEGALDGFGGLEGGNDDGDARARAGRWFFTELGVQSKSPRRRPGAPLVAATLQACAVYRPGPAAPRFEANHPD